MAPAPLGRIGEEVRDGKFAFTVTKTATSPAAGGHTAQGTYLTVAMTVRNTSTEPWSFFANAQKLKDFGGRFEASLGTFSRDFQDGDDITHAARLDVLRRSEGQPRPVIGPARLRISNMT